MKRTSSSSDESAATELRSAEQRRYGSACLADEHRTAPEGFIGHLIDLRRLSESAATRVRRVIEDTGECAVGSIVKLGLLSEAAAADAQAEYLHLQRARPEIRPQVAIELRGISAHFLREQEVLPLSLSESDLTVAVWDGLNEFAIRALSFAGEWRVVPVIATRSEIELGLRELYPEPGDSRASQEAVQDGTLDDELDQLRDLASDAPVIRLVQRIVNDAVARRSSDIHLEAEERTLKVRFRVDGLLQTAEIVPASMRDAVISRVKIMANLNIAERRLPQDGRIRVTVQGKEIDFRVATTPTLHGESMVLRILDRQEITLDFTSLGFEAGIAQQLRGALAKPHGIVLVSGPTGSGKTTTLYAALRELHTPDKKILTVEDPVEYTLDGLNQVHVKPSIGLTFASALRAFLRQDPDIMMVGEIRDRETAEIAIQAALTGHLLLSTLHTNSAAAAITRLLDMGIDDFLLTSTLNLVIGQRLVRRLCEQCRDPYAPSAEVLRHFGLDEPIERLYHPRGCKRCEGTGYQGRTSILELFALTDPIQKLILSRADANALEGAAVEAGMRTMFRHGIERAMDGTTTLEEVLRVTRAP